MERVMEWNDLLSDGYGRVPEILARVLDGLSREDLDKPPRNDCNSIGWLAWHLSRQQDAQISALMGEEQLWIVEKWHEKFGHAPDPKDIGFGHSPEQVAAFKSPDTETLLGYHQSVLNRAKQFIDTLPKSRLGEELNEPWFQPLPTVGVRLVSILGDSLQHAGQAAYLRGLLEGRGWQKF